MTALTGFFSQQLLRFEDCAQRTDAAAVLVAKTNYYTASERSTGIRNLSTMHAPIVAAVTVGLVQPREDYGNLFVRGCGSGNCTFPSDHGASFSTMAINYICEDISGLLRLGSGTTEFNATYTVLGARPRPVTGSRCAILGTPLNILDELVMSTSTTATGYGGSDLQPIWTVTLLFKPRMESTNLTAVNCTLFPTINTYSAEIRNTFHKKILV